MDLRAAQRLLVALVALPSTGLAYNALHIVDLYQVVCNSTGYVDIKLDVAQLSTEMFKPHVVSFLRSSNKQTIVTYTLVNSAGGEWTTGVQTVELKDLGGRRLAEEQGITIGARVQVKPSVTSPFYSWGQVTHRSVGTVTALDNDGEVVIIDFPEQKSWPARVSEIQAEGTTEHILEIAEGLDDGETDGQDSHDAAGRRLAGRRRGGSYSPRRRASYSPRRRAYRPPPRRRGGSYTSRRRGASSPTPSRPPSAALPRRRAASIPRRRASTSRPTSSTPTEAPRRRAIVAPRRRMMPAEAGPRRRTQAYAPPVQGAPVRYSSAGTGGSGYGYANQQQMYGNYGGGYNNGYPQVSPYGYSGYSSYGRPGGQSNAMMYAGAGFLAGAAVGVGGYYLYQRMSRASCAGYDCCYGCQNACYDGHRQNCDVNMSRQMYRDDLMTDSGFIPNDEKPWPLSIRIYSVAGAGYPSAPGAGICPAAGCSAANCTGDNDTAADAPEPQDLFLTLTVMETLADSSSHVPANFSNAQTGVNFLLVVPICMLALRALRRASF